MAFHELIEQPLWQESSRQNPGRAAKLTLERLLKHLEDGGVDEDLVEDVRDSVTGITVFLQTICTCGRLYQAPSKNGPAP